MRYTDSFLEQIRAALPVIELVQKHYKMRKAGSAEWVAIDDESLGVNTTKNVWRDFGKHDVGGDIFAFEMFVSKCTFQEAVERCAQTAGIALPNDKKKKANGHAKPTAAASTAKAPRQRNDIQITKTYDYVDADGALQYQVCRQEWVEDGKRKKTFLQRRPHGDNWIWGLSEGVYLRSPRNGDYYPATDERIRSDYWKDAERLDVTEACVHTLYRFDELREELAQDVSEQRTIYICEGEKDCDTLNGWGCVATTNSGGSKNWRDDLAEQLRDADVVILVDNDKAGIEHGHKVALSLRFVARRTRMLRWPEFWPDCPDKGDVTDWRDETGGDAAKFFEIVEQLRDWTPDVPASAFQAVRYSDIDKSTHPLQWTVKGILQRATVSLWYGATQSGKSFLLTSTAMAIARGQPWMGYKTRPGLVVYQTGEGGVGFRHRLRAYRDFHKLPASNDLPFVYLPARINLYEDEANVDALIAEIKAWSDYYTQPLELVAIDTFNAASGGANENLNQDVGRILERCRKIVDNTGAHVALVHHTPATGDRPRGHSSLMADVETAVAVTVSPEFHVEDRPEGPPARRPIRSWTLTKQKDGPSSVSRSFVLKSVAIGKDEEGDDITSCVVEQIGTAAQQAADEKVLVPKGWFQINANNKDIFQSLVRAIDKHGIKPPPDSGVPANEIAVRVGQWEDEMIELMLGHEDITPQVRQRIKQRVFRASKQWRGDAGGANLIGKSGHWVWRTGRKVYGVDRLPDRVVDAPRDEPKLLAPGETIEDMLNF